MNTSAGSSSPPGGRPFAVSPLQRAWLRELGLEKVWVAQPAPEDAPGRAAPAATGEAAVPAARPGAPVSVAEQSRADIRAPGEGRSDVAERPARPGASVNAAASGRPGGGAPSKPVARPVLGGGAAGGPDASSVAASGALRADQASAVAGMDLDALRERVLSCEACGLCAGRRQAVFGTGAQPASWLIIGEAPGEQEDRQGQPFVGRSGQLLDAMLASVGRSRETNVYIANVIKCRPPGNRNPKPEEIAACSPYLMRQIALLNPERILVMGRFAAQTLLGTEAAIGSLRGRLHSIRTESGRDIPVVVSYHPAYLLRSPHEKAKAWADLQLAAKT